MRQYINIDEYQATATMRRDGNKVMGSRNKISGPSSSPGQQNDMKYKRISIPSTSEQSQTRQGTI